MDTQVDNTIVRRQAYIQPVVVETEGSYRPGKKK